MSTGSSTPVEARAGSTAAKTARLTVLAPLTAVLEKPTSSAAKASAANPHPDMCQSVIVFMFMRAPMLCACIRRRKDRLAGWSLPVGVPRPQLPLQHLRARAQRQCVRELHAPRVLVLSEALLGPLVPRQATFARKGAASVACSRCAGRKSSYW